MDSGRHVRSTALVLAACLFCGPNGLLAGDRRGAEVMLTTVNGAVVSGELLAVGERSLVLKGAGGSETSFETADISRVVIRRSANRLPGVLLGGLIGAACGAVYGLAQSGGHDDFAHLGVAVYTPPAAALGAILGGAMGGGRKKVVFEFAHLSDPQLKVALVRLRHEARIRD
jgi:hypothetical protein